MRLLLGLLLTAPAFAAPTLDFEGACPGDGSFSVSGLEPGASFHFVYGQEEGSGTIVATHCAGHEVGIVSPQTHDVAFVAGDDGERVFDWAISTNYCGKLVQVVNVDTCELSDVLAMPSFACDWDTETYDGTECIEHISPDCDWETEHFDGSDCVAMPSDEDGDDDGVCYADGYSDGFGDGYTGGFSDGYDIASTTLAVDCDTDCPCVCDDDCDDAFDCDTDCPVDCDASCPIDGDDDIPYAETSGACRVACTPGFTQAYLTGVCNAFEQAEFASAHTLGDCGALGQVCGADLIWTPEPCEDYPEFSCGGEWTETPIGCIDTACADSETPSPPIYTTTLESWDVDFAFTHGGDCDSIAETRADEIVFSGLGSAARRTAGRCTGDGTYTVCDETGHVIETVSCSEDMRCYDSLYPDPEVATPPICEPSDAESCTFYDEGEASCTDGVTLNVCDPHYGIYRDTSCPGDLICGVGMSVYSTGDPSSFCANIDDLLAGSTSVTTPGDNSGADPRYDYSNYEQAPDEATRLFYLPDPGCGDVTYEGECADDGTLLFCDPDVGLTFGLSCELGFECGYNEDYEFFDCIADDEDDDSAD